MKIKFSVLLSVYSKSKAHEVEECLSSIVLQTLPPDETVIVLDGPISADIVHVIDSFKPKMTMKVVKIDRNVGLGAALNIGIANCDNEVIGRIDSDDICALNRFEVQLPYLESNHRLAVIGSDVILFNEDGNIGCRRVPTTNEEIIKFSRLRNPFNHPTVMFRKKEILDLGGYPEVRYSQDYLLWLKCIINGKNMANIPEPLVFMRHDSSLIERRGLKMIKYDNSPYLFQYREGMISLPRLIFCVSIRVGYQIINSLKASGLRLLRAFSRGK